MAKSKPQNQPANPPDLPEELSEIVQRARDVAVPYANDHERETIGKLYTFLTPAVVKDPRYKGDGKAPKALREPMLLIAWDRRAGLWKASLTDKVLNVGGSAYHDELESILVAVERALKDGTFKWSERKIT